MTGIRRSAVIAGGIAALTLAPSASGSTARERGACRDGAAVSANAVVRIVEHRRSLYGCARREGRVTRLVIGGVYGSAWSHVALRGRMVAFATAVTSKGPPVYRVYVVDVVRGRRCSGHLAGTGGTGDPADGTLGSGAPVSALVLGAGGAVAYVAGPAHGPLNPTFAPDVAPWSGYEVMAVDAAGRRRLGVGFDVDPASLRLDGSTATWTAAGAQRAAALSAEPVVCRRRAWI